MASSWNNPPSKKQQFSTMRVMLVFGMIVMMMCCNNDFIPETTAFVLPTAIIHHKNTRVNHGQGDRTVISIRNHQGLLWAAAANEDNSPPKKSRKNKKVMTEEEIKKDLQAYLEKRASGATTQEEKITKVVGGTKGNKVLEYISGAPAKERIVVEEEGGIFDYDALEKYGYGYLVTPIMETLGGRRAVYELMGMEAPPLKGPPPKVSAPKLEIDRTGSNDPARYTGLKLGQVLDDDTMGQALERAAKKAKEGAPLRAKLLEEEFERPFADKRNTGPQQTPDWTPERLDEYTKAQGQALSWARRAKLGEFQQDPYEALWGEVPFGQRAYGLLSWVFVCFAFGRSTPTFLTSMVHLMDEKEASNLLTLLKAPALALIFASIGSCVYCAAVLAPERQRSAGVWAYKGLTGGPLTIQQLRDLPALITNAEQEQLDKQQKQQKREP